jgi:hypothetical protein
MKLGNKKSGGGSSSFSAPSSSGVEWQKADTKLTRNCVFISLSGPTGSGRTSFALSAPGPIALIHASEKLEGVVQKQAGDKDINLFDFGVTLSGGPNERAKQAAEVLEATKEAWTDAFSWARTIVLDTHTEFWELLRYARFGTLTPKGHVGNLYTPVNAEMSSFLKEFRGQNSTNIIAIGHEREKYRNDRPTGKMEQAGHKFVPYYSDVIIHTGRNVKTGSFEAEILKGWWNAHVESLEFEDEDISFSYLMSLVTETDEETWS